MNTMGLLLVRYVAKMVLGRTVWYNYGMNKPKSNHTLIVNMYASGKYTTERIAQLNNISTKQVQRIAKANGVIRTQAEANRISVPLKRYPSTPPELRSRHNRKHVGVATRYVMLLAQPYCTLCRGTDRLEIDHIDNDATNSTDTNLQVLCSRCNLGKAVVSRSG